MLWRTNWEEQAKLDTMGTLLQWIHRNEHLMHKLERRSNGDTRGGRGPQRFLYGAATNLMLFTMIPPLAFGLLFVGVASAVLPKSVGEPIDSAVEAVSSTLVTGDRHTHIAARVYEYCSAILRLINIEDLSLLANKENMIALEVINDQNRPHDRYEKIMVELRALFDYFWDSARDNSMCHFLCQEAIAFTLVNLCEKCDFSEFFDRSTHEICLQRDIFCSDNFDFSRKTNFGKLAFRIQNGNIQYYSRWDNWCKLEKQYHTAELNQAVLSDNLKAIRTACQKEPLLALLSKTKGFGELKTEFPKILTNNGSYWVERYRNISMESEYSEQCPTK